MQGLSRLFRRVARTFTPESHARQLRSEVDYWKLWFETRGLEWPQDYRDRLDPDLPLQEWICAYVDRLGHEEIAILDVGSGPLTKLGKVHPPKRLSIAPVDQLADEYNQLIDSFGVDPPIRTQSCDAEKLTGHFRDRRFDIVHAENSMDHSQDALAAIREMVAMTRPGGFTLLLHAEHEGKNNRYSGLHQWDFLCENGHFIVAGPGPDGPRHDISELYSRQADVECWLHDDGVFVAMLKR
jgi:SAM-dependent methyltransferase